MFITWRGEVEVHPPWGLLFALALLQPSGTSLCIKELGKSGKQRGRREREHAFSPLPIPFFFPISPTPPSAPATRATIPPEEIAFHCGSHLTQVLINTIIREKLDQFVLFLFVLVLWESLLLFNMVMALLTCLCRSLYFICRHVLC